MLIRCAHSHHFLYKTQQQQKMEYFVKICLQARLLLTFSCRTKTVSVVVFEFKIHELSFGCCMAVARSIYLYIIAFCFSYNYAFASASKTAMYERCTYSAAQKTKLNVKIIIKTGCITSLVIVPSITIIIYCGLCAQNNRTSRAHF